MHHLARSARALVIASVLVAATAPARSDQTDMTARNETIVREAFDNWRAGGNVFAELLAPDIKWTIHGSGPVAGTYVGVEDFVERAAAPLTSRLATPIVPEVHGIWASGDTVIVRFDGSATTTSGAPYTNQFAWIFRMNDDRVTEAEAFLDLAAYQAVVDNAPRAD
ncbi:nuclear transport factor 2 family protein [Mesorhizobium sp. LHD-90]|uniref:nuclear transport factor 2 family protein n=1 Tax=Mesorhizobium sp. LHD-90 TaxID=3071414 RepID=UPI0027E0C5D9|nr:nuclear transport factor 2 family protein [Mesorhizobium sp. LHD-90]MDQ6436471.1 nuclear transport factor 2 family protein [Mesorhizobium sp. LHD-90]